MAKDFIKLKEKLAIMKQQNNWTTTKTIKDFLKQNDIAFQENYDFYDMTFDIYIPEYKLAIDILYVNKHNEQALASLFDMCQYDIKKMFHIRAIKCKQFNIHHIFIWDYMWNDDRQRAIIQSLILNCTGKSQHSVMARKTYIKVLRAFDTRQFFQENNMQGYRVAKDAICLFDKETNELLMSYTIGHAYFGKGKYDLEIARGACKLGHHIIGGTSKLWNYIINNYAPGKSIVYYVDLNYFNGRSLDKLCEQFPDMHYIGAKYSFKNWFVEEQKMKNRDPMHHKDICKLVDEGKVLTCWDAGSLVYVYSKNDASDKI